MTITADKTDVAFEGNRAKWASSGPGIGDDIYLDGTLTLLAKEGRTISFDGGIRSGVLFDSGRVLIGGDGYEGAVVFEKSAINKEIQFELNSGRLAFKSTENLYSQNDYGTSHNDLLIKGGTLGTSAIKEGALSMGSLSFAGSSASTLHFGHSADSVGSLLAETVSVGAGAKVIVKLDDIGSLQEGEGSYILISSESAWQGEGGFSSFSLSERPLSSFQLYGEGNTLYLVAASQPEEEGGDRLIWNGTDSGHAWNDGGADKFWLFAEGSHGPAAFRNGNSITFSDSAQNKDVVLTTKVWFADMTVTGTAGGANDYLFTSNGGKLVGSGTLEKSGANTLTVENGVMTSSWLGAVNIQGGTVVLHGAKGVEFSSLAMADGTKLSLTDAASLEIHGASSGVARLGLTGGSSLTAGGDLTISALDANALSLTGTLSDNGGNTLTSAEGDITVKASLIGDGNRLTAQNGTVNLNAEVSGADLKVAARDLLIGKALITNGGSIAASNAMSVNAAADLTNVKLTAARTDITGSNSRLIVRNAGDFGSLGNVNVSQQGRLSLAGATDGAKSALTAGLISVSANSGVSLVNTALTGSIQVNADTNTLTLDKSSVSGDVTLLGTQNTLTMSDSSIEGTLTMTGGTFNLHGANTVETLFLNRGALSLSLGAGATLETTGEIGTVIADSGVYTIEGTHTGAIMILDGIINLGSSHNPGTLDGNLVMASGSLNYNNGGSILAQGKRITLSGEAGFARNINVNADWNASGNTLAVDASGTINLGNGGLTLGSIASGAGRLTVNGSHDLTLNGTGAHTGDIVLNGSVDLTAGAKDALGIEGKLIVNGSHTLTVTGDQAKDILLENRDDSLSLVNEGEVTLGGFVDSHGKMLKSGAGDLTLAKAAIDSLEATAGAVIGKAGDNSFGDLAAQGGNITLNAGNRLMDGSNISAIQGTITLNGVKATNGGDMTTQATGNLLVHGGELHMNDVNNAGQATFDKSVKATLNGLISSVSLNVGSAEAGDKTLVNVTQSATLSGETHIGAGSALVAGGDMALSDIASIDGTLSGRDVALTGATVTGDGGTLKASQDLSLDADSELVMTGNSTVKAGADMTVDGSADISGSVTVGSDLAVNGSLDITGSTKVTGDIDVSGSLASDGTARVGGSLHVTDEGDAVFDGAVTVSDKTTIAGNGSVSLDATGSSDLGDVSVSDSGHLDIAGNGNSISADNITMDDKGSGSISGSILNLNGGRGSITLNDQASLDISETTINGSIATTNKDAADSTHLGLDEVKISGDLTVVGGDLVLSRDNTVSGSLHISDSVNVTVNHEGSDKDKGTLTLVKGTTIDPDGKLDLAANSNLISDVTMTGGSFTINGNEAGNNFDGSLAFKPQAGASLADAPVVTINGEHNQKKGITVDADAAINVSNDSTLNIKGMLSSGSNGDDTLTLNGNGETGKVVISSSNKGFADDLDIGGGTLVIDANEAIGREGTLSIIGTDVTLQNTSDGATVSKDIATNGNGLTIRTDEDFTLAGQLDAAADSIIKTGEADLVLSHDPDLNDAKSVIGTLKHNEGNITLDGTDYTIGALDIAAGEHNFTSQGGNTFHNVNAGEGSSLVLNATNPATNGSRADVLGNSGASAAGVVNLDGAVLDATGTLLGLAELHVGTSENARGSSAALFGAQGMIIDTTVDAGSTLTLDTSKITGTDLVNSGTTNVTDTELTLDGELHIGNGGTLNIDGASIIDSHIVLAHGAINILEGSASVITKDSILEFNAGLVKIAGDRLVNVHENFTMEGTIAMNSDGTIMVDSGKSVNVNGGFIGTEDLYKNGKGTLAATASNAYGSGSTLGISGGEVTVITGTKNGEAVRFDSAMKVEGDHAFTVNTLAHTTWNGPLSGTQGVMSKVGGSTLTINHTGSHGFTTAIKVNEGALALNGNIGSNVALAKGTMLSGNGSTLGHVNARADDTIIEIGEAGKAWTGSSDRVETLTLGSASFERSEADCMGVYKTGTKTIVDLDLAHTACDKLVITGKADLNNSLVEIRKGVYTPEQERSIADGTRFHIVEVGSLAGCFNEEVQHDLYLRNAHLENSATGTDLVLSINHKGADKSENQKGVSGVIEGIQSDHIASGNLLDMINAFDHTHSAAESKAALDSVGGLELGTMMSSLLAGNISHLRTLRSSIGNGTYSASVTFDGKGGLSRATQTNTEVWISPTTAYNKGAGDGNAPGFTRNSWGALMGIERSLNSCTLVGAAFGYDYARTEDFGATNEADTYNIDFYGTHNCGAWTHSMTLGVGFHNFDNDRFVTVGDRFARAAKGGTSGMSLNFSYELARKFTLDRKSSISPLFTMESSLAWIGKYAEEGSIGNAGLRIDRQDAWSTILGLGGRYEREFGVFEKAPKASFNAMALVTFDVGDQGAPISASFQGAPGRTFTIQPVSNERVGALLGAGVSVPFTERLSGFGGSSLEFRDGTRSLNANVGVRYTF